MAERAKISSIDSLEAFRADLIQYVEKARVALDDAESEVRRMRTWLDVDRTNFWTAQMKSRVKQLEQAEAELYNAMITRPKENHAFYKMAVTKAKRRLAEAEEKILVLKKWRRDFDNRTTPLVRRLDPAYYMISRQLPDGIHALTEMIKSLQSYAEKGPVTVAPVTVIEEGGEA